MNTEDALAFSLEPGDRIRYRDVDVTITGPQEPEPNPFGLPWFRFPVRTDDGRKGFAKFGNSHTHVIRYITEGK